MLRNLSELIPWMHSCLDVRRVSQYERVQRAMQELFPPSPVPSPPEIQKKFYYIFQSLTLGSTVLHHCRSHKSHKAAFTRQTNVSQLVLCWQTQIVEFCMNDTTTCWQTVGNKWNSSLFSPPFPQLVVVSF